MSNGNVDRIPVNQLSDRYDLARSAVYKRMADLGIEREKIGNRAYLNQEQIALLDELHEFIKIGGNVAEFIARKGLKPAGENASSHLASPETAFGEVTAGLALDQTDMVKLLSAFASEFASAFASEFASQLQPQADLLAYYESLEKAASRGWKLRSSELAALLKLSVEEIEGYGNTFYEAGFVFNRSGYRAGGESAWRVSKGQ